MSLDMWAVAHHAIVAGGYGSHIGERVIGDLSGELLQLGHQRNHGLVNAARQLHRVGTGGHNLHSLRNDGSGQDSGGGGAVTGCVIRLRCRLCLALPCEQRFEDTILL